MSDPTPGQSKAITAYLLETTLQGIDPLIRSLEMLPDDRLDEQPVPEQYPVGKMIEHALGAATFASRALRLGKCEEADVADLMFDDESTGTRARILETEQLAREEIARALAELDEVAATRTIEFWFGWSLSGLETANLGYKELCHHRGQVQSFLRLMGYTPPGIYETPVSGSDETGSQESESESPAA